MALVFTGSAKSLSACSAIHVAGVALVWRIEKSNKSKFWIIAGPDRLTRECKQTIHYSSERAEQECQDAEARLLGRMGRVES